MEDTLHYKRNGSGKVGGYIRGLLYPCIGGGSIFPVCFVRSQGKYKLLTRVKGEHTIDLPDDFIEDTMYIIESTIFFQAGDKFYRAFFGNTFGYSHMRFLHEGETPLTNGLCSKIRNGEKYIYLSCDDRDEDGVLVDVPEERLKGLQLYAIHRDKLIYTSNQEKGVSKLSENITVVSDCVSFVSDNTQYAMGSEGSYILYFDLTSPSPVEHKRVRAVYNGNDFYSIKQILAWDKPFVLFAKTIKSDDWLIMALANGPGETSGESEDFTIVEDDDFTTKQ